MRVWACCNCCRYQLTYYVFKVRNRSIADRLRCNLHRLLSKCHCVQMNWPSNALRLPWREAFTQEEEELAMSYLLYRYSDFIDRRRGSIAQKGGNEPYTSGGVLLEPHVVGLLREEREALATSAEQEEDMKDDIRAIVKEEVERALELDHQRADNKELLVEQLRRELEQAQKEALAAKKEAHRVQAEIEHVRSAVQSASTTLSAD
eukprot:COSAG02_NODE_449_length_22094_cov_4.917027_16_plen_205_part_00